MIGFQDIAVIGVVSMALFFLVTAARRRMRAERRRQAACAACPFAGARQRDIKH